MINFSNYRIVAALRSRTYLDGEISVHAGCRPSLADSSFITHKNLYVFKLFRDKSRIFTQKMYITRRSLTFARGRAISVVMFLSGF